MSRLLLHLLAFGAFAPLAFAQESITPQPAQKLAQSTFREYLKLASA